MFDLREVLMRGARALLVALVLATCLAACGGGSDGDAADNGNDSGNVDDGNGSTGGDDDSGGDSTDDDDDSGDDSDDDGNDDDAAVNAPRALMVIGQRDFTGNLARQGGAQPDAGTLNMPMGPVAWSAEEDVLFIADAEDARVLGFRGIPTANGTNADFVIGQSDFTSATKTVSANGMISPQHVSTDGGRLIVTDNDGNRILVHDGIPTAGNAAPALVVGQETLDDRTGSCDASSLIHPHGHFLTPNGKLLVADAANNRVLVWNELPGENGMPADLVLGQNSFTNCSFRGDENFKHPSSLWSDGTRLVIADSEKHRVLIWHTFPTTNFARPDVILGQRDVFHVAPNDKDQDGATDADGTTSAAVLSYPRGVWVENNRLYVADMDNHRVLIWNTLPTTTFTPADAVIGQEDMSANQPNAGQAGVNAYGFQRPVGVRVNDGQLFVTDWENSRVLVFDAQ